MYLVHLLKFVCLKVAHHLFRMELIRASYYLLTGLLRRLSTSVLRALAEDEALVSVLQ